MTNLHRLMVILAVVALPPSQAVAQGEATSAIVGQVRDATNAAVPGAAVAIASLETGLRRSAKTDDAGRFNFPQLKPGIYSVEAEAQGFEPQKNDNVISGLGYKQTVDFTLRVARSNETVGMNSEAPLINPPARQSFGRCALGDFSGRLSLTDQTMLCYNLHAGHGRMLRVVGLPVRTPRDVLPYGFLSIKPRNSVIWGGSS